MVEQVGRDVSNVNDSTMASLHIELQRCATPLDNFLSWCISSFGTDVPFPSAVSALFVALGKSSPVCALFPQWESLEALYHKVVHNVPIKQCPSDMLLLQQSCPLLFDTVSFMEGDLIPDALCSLVKDLLRIAKAPFNVDPVPETPEEDTNHVQHLEYFPCLPVVRGRGNYCFDTASSLANICTKRSKRHPSLLPGIFLLHCQHGITYGFSVMHSNESPNTPFTVFRMRFRKAPRLIVYDNACNLHSYSLNRDPVFFKNSQFLVDRLHWRDHTGIKHSLFSLIGHPDGLNKLMIIIIVCIFP